MFTLKAKDCPFCDNDTEEGTLPDARLNEGSGHYSSAPSPCKHSFTEIDFGAMEFTILEAEKTLKEDKKILSKMRREMKKQSKNTDAKEPLSFLGEDKTSNEGREKEDGYLMSYGVKWCICEDKSNAHYVDDTPTMKHHWKCNHCGYVVQIG